MNFSTLWSLVRIKKTAKLLVTLACVTAMALPITGCMTAADEDSSAEDSSDEEISEETDETATSTEALDLSVDPDSAIDDGEPLASLPDNASREEPQMSALAEARRATGAH